MAEVVIQSPQINQISVVEENQTLVLQTSTQSLINVIAEGPQGPPGSGINDTAKVDKSIVYYDALAQQFKADAIWTTSTLTDGGNF
jgi:hypothetical protein